MLQAGVVCNLPRHLGMPRLRHLVRDQSRHDARNQAFFVRSRCQYVIDFLFGVKFSMVLSLAALILRRSVQGSILSDNSACIILLAKGAPPTLAF